MREWIDRDLGVECCVALGVTICGIQREFLQPKKGLDEVDNCGRRMARFDAERNDQVSDVRVHTGASCNESAYRCL